MNKFLCLILSIVMVFSLMACGAKDDVAATPTDEVCVDTPADVDPVDIYTIEEIHGFALPAGYIMTITNTETDEVIDEGEYGYTDEDTALIPDWADWDEGSETLKASSIEDDMVYTLASFTKTIDDVSEEGEVLYITDPDTEAFVACSVKLVSTTTLYQFIYD